MASEGAAPGATAMRVGQQRGHRGEGKEQATRVAASGLSDQPPGAPHTRGAQTAGGWQGAMDGEQQERRIARMGHSAYAYSRHVGLSSWSCGLAIERAR